MKTLILISLTMIGCANEVASETPVNTERVPVESSIATSSPTTQNLEFDTYPLDADSDGWSVKAEALWQDATVNGVRFRHHGVGESFECRPGIITVQRIPLDDWTSFATSVGADPNGFGTAIPHAEGCTDIRLVWPWPKDKETLFTSKFDTLGENPLVLVVAHEIGHVLKLDHGASNDRSLMVERFENLKVNRPTCLDVNRLGLILGRPMTCKETF